MKTKLLLSLTLLIVIIAACTKEVVTKAISLNLPAVSYDYMSKVSQEPFNFHTTEGFTNEVATLGRVLFYDPVLSINNTNSCASCHHQDKAFSDGVAASKGFLSETTPRNSIAIVNPLSTNRYFWDGRSTQLEEQVLMPIENHIEMGIEDKNLMIAKVKGQEYYNSLFTNAFGSDEISSEKIAKALAAFVGSMTSYNSKFDQVQKGSAVYTELEAEGKSLFEKKYQCNSCHGGNNFNANWGSVQFANIGLAKEEEDKGFAGQGRFKVPNLRNAVLTAPYMHDGSIETLNDVLDHYSEGIQDNPNLDWRLQRFKNENGGGMNISPSEKQALLAFLHTLTDKTLLTDQHYSNPFQ